MKNCINCGAAAPNNAPACGQCGRAFAFVSGGRAQEVQLPDISGLRERPDGSRLLTLGWVFLALGVLMFVLAISSTGRSTYYDPDLDALARQWTFTMLSGGFFGLSLVLLLAGLIVRAIWFLPGPDYKAPPSNVVHVRLGDGQPQSTGIKSGRPGFAGDDGAVV